MRLLRDNCLRLGLAAKSDRRMTGLQRGDRAPQTTAGEVLPSDSYTVASGVVIGGTRVVFSRVAS
jgi:hypothetical protein